MARLLQHAWLLLGLPSFGSVVKGQNVASADLSQLYFDVLASYNAFPPLGEAEVWMNNTVEPIQSFIASVFVSIDVISPATSEFTITSRKLLYWNRDACNLTEAHEYACSNPIGTFHFLKAVNSDSDPQTNFQFHRDTIHQSDFEALGLSDLTPSVDIIEDQVTYRQQFDVRTYPYEYHNLEIQFQSLYSSNIVNLTALPLDPNSIIPSVPAGWTLRNIECSVREGQEGRAITEVSDGQIFFPSYTCTVLVSKTNTGWWLTSFLLFFGLNFISYIGGLGVTSHLVAEAKDDKDSARAGLFDGMRIIGVFSIGLLLTYVFQVELAPYSQPVEFWPSIAASTMIYVLGLVGILVAALLAMVSAMAAKQVLVVDGFKGSVMCAYDLSYLPKEGEAPEEQFPLLDREEPQEGDQRSPLIWRFLRKQKSGESRDISRKTEAQDDHPQLACSTHQRESVPSTDNTENAAEKGVVGDDDEKSRPEEDETMVASESRRSNTKSYSVLSVQEAVVINKFVLYDFIARTFVIVSLALSGSIILIKASIEYNDAIS